MRGNGGPDASVVHDPVVVDHLTKRFGDFTAVDRVSFRVAAGEIFGFLGPNGAGKTTTIRMLTGLLPPTEGRALVAGRDVATERGEVKRALGYMSQRFSLYPDLSVDENITLFAGLYGVEGDRFRDRRRWILDMADLERAGGRPAGDLPLGWKQRLALGCAVVHEPSILFLDEPTSGVDPAARRRFWDLIDDLAAGGTTVFVSTHYMEEAEFCHRLALMNRGRLIALDDPEALRRRVDVPILDVETDDAPGAAEALQGVAGIREASMFGRRLRVMVEDEVTGTKRVEEVLAGAGRRVRGMRHVPPSLEDVFVALVQREGGAPR